MELDHLFICCAVNAPEGETLNALGLVEGLPNHHPGQGTANRRYFFHNAFLELLWVTDRQEAQSELVRRTGLCERWDGRGRAASPFGIGLRPSSREQQPLDSSTTHSRPCPPLPSWEYRPPYLPAPLAIHMGTNSDLPVEPLLFYIDFGRRPDSYPPPRQQPVSHAQPFKEITCVRITGRRTILGPQESELSPALQAVLDHCPWLGYALGSEDLLEIGFDNERTGHRRDFRPALPLIFSW